MYAGACIFLSHHLPIREQLNPLTSRRLVTLATSIGVELGWSPSREDIGMANTWQQHMLISSYMTKGAKDMPVVGSQTAV